MSRTFQIGLIVNPYAGIGGSTALKGSDGEETRTLALSRGAELLANKKTKIALSELPSNANVKFLTASGDMGETAANELGFPVEVVYQPKHKQTEAEDTKALAQRLLDKRVDIIVFAGGDGTATDIYNTVQNRIPVLGIPAGCKIHSGVYAVSPKSAGKVLKLIVDGELVSVRDAEVRDIDEIAFRKGKVIARPVGDMQVPEELRYIQAVKMGGKEVDELVIADIADYLQEVMDEHEDTYFVIGSGSTIDGVMSTLNLQNTLLGVDLVKNSQVIASDVTAAKLLEMTEHRKVKIIVTVIGGQGHIFGRGNQQISPALIRRAGLENIIVVASKSKLQGLEGRPLLVDTGDPSLDFELSGRINVICGFRDHVLYPVDDLSNDKK